jgi:hypothetical protein
MAQTFREFVPGLSSFFRRFFLIPETVVETEYESNEQKARNVHADDSPL